MTRVLSLLTTAIGVAVLYGWWADVSALLSVREGWVTMKPTTAASLLCLGSACALTPLAYDHSRVAITSFVSICSASALLMMVGVVMSWVVGVDLGFDHLIARESHSAVHSVAPGVPSIGTCLVVVPTAIAMLRVAHDFRHPARCRALSRLAGRAAALIGAVGALGYAIDVPVLYWSISNVSTAMAVHTCIGATLLGVALLLTAEEPDEHFDQRRP